MNIEIIKKSKIQNESDLFYIMNRIMDGDSRWIPVLYMETVLDKNNFKDLETFIKRIESIHICEDEEKCMCKDIQYVWYQHYAFYGYGGDEGEDFSLSKMILCYLICTSYVPISINFMVSENALDDLTWINSSFEYMYNPFYWYMDMHSTDKNYAKYKFSALVGLYNNEVYEELTQKNIILAKELLDWPNMRLSNILAREENRKRVGTLILCSRKFNPNEYPFGSNNIKEDLFKIIFKMANLCCPNKFY